MQSLKHRPAIPRVKGRRKRAKIKLSRKRVLLAGAAAVLMVLVGKSLLPAMGVSAPGLGGGNGEPTDVVTKAPSPPTIDLNGVMVHGGGTPMITQNPGLVRVGGNVTVSGNGFDQGSMIDVYLGAAAQQPGA